MAMNAYILKLDAETSEIAPVYEEPGEKAILVSTSDFRRALIAWITKLSK